MTLCPHPHGPTHCRTTTTILPTATLTQPNSKLFWPNLLHSQIVMATGQIEDGYCNIRTSNPPPNLQIRSDLDGNSLWSWRIYFSVLHPRPRRGIKIQLEIWIFEFDKKKQILLEFSVIWIMTVAGIYMHLMMMKMIWGNNLNSSIQETSPPLSCVLAHLLTIRSKSSIVTPKSKRK